MKDKYLREQLIKTGILDEALWGSTHTKDKLKEAYEVGRYHAIYNKRDIAKVDRLSQKMDMLLDYLSIEVKDEHKKLVKKIKKK